MPEGDGATAPEGDATTAAEGAKPDDKATTTTTATTAGTETAQGGSADAGDDDIPEGLGDAGKEALKRERAAVKAERKRADDMAAKIKEFEDRDKTEAQKQAEKLADTEKRAAAAERSVLVHEVAAKKGLTGELADLASRLIGTTKEELEKDADKLLKSVGAAGGTSLDQGARGRKSSGSSGNDAVNDWLRKGAGVAT